MRVSASNPRTTLRIAFPDWTLTIVACTATHSQRRPSHMSLSAIVFAVGARFVLSRRSWWRGVGGAHLMTVSRIRCCWPLYRPAQTKNIPRIPPIEIVSLFELYRDLGDARLVGGYRVLGPYSAGKQPRLPMSECQPEPPACSILAVMTEVRRRCLRPARILRHSCGVTCLESARVAGAVQVAPTPRIRPRKSRDMVGARLMERASRAHPT